LNGGWEPLWDGESRRVFYLDLDSLSIIYRDLIDEELLLFGEEVVYSGLPSILMSDSPNYAILPDSSNAVVIQTPANSARLTDTVLVENFFSELERLLPTDAGN
jgi:hypothetical protein